MEFVPTYSGNEDMPIWTRKAIVTIWEVLEDIEAGNVYARNFLWMSKDFLRHVKTSFGG